MKVDASSQTDYVKIVDSEPIQQNSRTRNNENGPLIQMYDCLDLTKVTDYYYGMMEALREIPVKYGETFKHINRSRIIDASQQKIEYLGHRWHLLDRSYIEKIREPVDIGETKQAFKQKKGFVAIIDKDESFVKNVFAKNTDLASHLQIKSVSIVSTAINHRNGVLHGFNDIKLKMWDELSQELKDKYLKTNDLPTSEKREHGKKIDILDATTKAVIETMPCIDAVCKKYKVSPNTVKEKCTCWNDDGGIFKGKIRFKVHE